MITEQLDTSIPQDQQVIASPVASPVMREDLAAALSGVSLEGMMAAVKQRGRVLLNAGQGLTAEAGN